MNIKDFPKRCKEDYDVTKDTLLYHVKKMEEALNKVKSFNPDGDLTINEMIEICKKSREIIDNRELLWKVYTVRDEDGWDLYPEIHREGSYIDDCECHQMSFHSSHRTREEAEAELERIKK